ncbi:MAG: BCCT family transporter [Gemmatimonadales bacterium]|nr:MAG: BCCT family transporter [Gemmatimonadales bacterium]
MDWKEKLELSPGVFFPAIIIIGIFLVFGVFFVEQTEQVFDVVQGGIVDNFGWFYVMSVAFFLFFVIALFFSPWGSIRLGEDDSEPEYSYFSWFAMLFSAGMGIGLVFWSVAEPMFYYLGSPTVESETVEAASEAMRLTFFHWGVHAWAIYIVVGLSLAYFSFRKGLPLSIRSAFHPLLGDRIHGPIGHTIDVLAIFGTIFGVATSLGLGVMQVAAGIDYLFGLGLEDATGLQLGLITVITLIATGSVVAGLDKGIRRLSNFNMTVAVILVLFVFAVGPTVFLLNNWVENTGNYLSSIVETTFWIDAWGDGEWHGTWTLFYWGWWIAWSPFVGMFIARVSRGRTIREFIGGVLLVPAAFTTFWLTTFGNSGLHRELFGEGGIAGVGAEEMLFALLQGFPLSAVTSILAMIVIIAFFVTSSDSGSLVIDMLASGGNPDPPKVQRVFWALLEGAVAGVLLWAGGLAALQTAAIATGLPFAAVLVVMCISLLKALRSESRDRGRVRKVFPAKGRGDASPVNAEFNGGDHE